MNRYYYDFHIHSCLSPCADMDMTPNNIVNIAVLNGLDVIALTDHNSAKNCPAAAAVAKNSGIKLIPGMELTTREEIHVICLFPDVDSAMSFDSFVYKKLPKIENDPKIWGEQTILDSNDNIAGTESILLLNAADIGISEVPAAVKNHGGTAFPAHINKNSNSVLSALGCIPPEFEFNSYEIAKGTDVKSIEEMHPALKNKRALFNSDAHYLIDIKQKNDFILLENLIVKNFIKML